MKFIEAILKSKGQFLNRVDLVYSLKNGKTKIYETIQRKVETDGYKIGHHDAESVAMVVFNEDSSKILINKEFRMSVNREIYNIPAGLIDKGETVTQAAKRELMEEAGLEITQIIKILTPSFVNIGEGNTNCILIYAKAEGEPKSEYNPVEEIIPMWIDKEKAKDILKSDAITARTQVILDIWANGLPV